MKCAWNELLRILPAKVKTEIEKAKSRMLLEIRMRVHQYPELVFPERSEWMKEQVTQDDLEYVINAVSQCSPWTITTMSCGYITAEGGHRIGICGDAVLMDERMKGIKNISSLCIRVARDHVGIGASIAKEEGNILILGAPGWGKTSLLRDVVRWKAKTEQVCVVDERRELYPHGMERGLRMDVMTGCPKRVGIEMMMKTMSPQYIAVDEITTAEDCDALVRAANCGVGLMATAHANSVREFRNREIYRPLVEQGIFHKLVVLQKDKSFHLERMSV